MLEGMPCVWMEVATLDERRNFVKGAAAQLPVCYNEEGLSSSERQDPVRGMEHPGEEHMAEQDWEAFRMLF